MAISLVTQSSFRGWAKVADFTDHCLLTLLLIIHRTYGDHKEKIEILRYVTERSPLYN